MGSVQNLHVLPPAQYRRAAHIQRLLEPGAVQPVYQPIVRLSDLQPIGYEGLARFPHAPGLSELPPDVTLAAAAEIGLREDLEVACWAAMATAGSPPEGRLLFVNIDPVALRHPGLLALADKLPSRLVIELTEQRAVEDYEELRALLAPWLDRGAAIAVDDTGAAYASLEHVVELRPDFLKLSRQLITGIDRDANRQALLRAMVAFAREVGAVVVAEGVEREEELGILLDCDVDYGQGWLFGRPGPPWPAMLPVRAPAREALSDSSVRRLQGLEMEVHRAGSIRGACEAVCEHLSRAGLVPAVYLEHGGRLRVQAARGAWQVLDGIEPGVGLPGRCYATRQPVLVPDLSLEPDATGLVSGMQAGLAVPLIVSDRLVGVVAAQTATPLGAKAASELERGTAFLARRLCELGGLEAATPGQRLARAASRLARMTDPRAVVREVAGAAREVAGLEAAAVVLSDARPRTDTMEDALAVASASRIAPRGRLVVAPAEGALENALYALEPDTLAELDAWVGIGSASISSGDLAAKSSGAAEAVRRAGAGTLVVLPLGAGEDERLGLLILADRSTVVLPTEHVELLELLAMQASAGLRTAKVERTVRDIAAHDPLTGLGHHGALHEALPGLRATAAEHGCSVAVILADLDGFKAVNDRDGHQRGDEVLRETAALLGELAPAGAQAFRYGPDEFALVAATDGRSGAQSVAYELWRLARERLGTTVSVGVALDLEGEPDRDLLARAELALAQMARSGGDGVAVAPPRLSFAERAERLGTPETD